MIFVMYRNMLVCWWFIYFFIFFVLRRIIRKEADMSVIQMEIEEYPSGLLSQATLLAKATSLGGNQ